jgi:ankyrin repeat protein
MGKSVRLSDGETEAIRNKCIEINKLLIKNGQQPLKDSELVHKILELSVAYARVQDDGAIFLDLQ